MSIKMVTAVLTVMMAIGLDADICLAEPRPVVVQHIRNLADPDFDTRESAQKALQDMGPSVLDDLDELRSNPGNLKDILVDNGGDPEVLNRLDTVSQNLHDKQGLIKTNGDLTMANLEAIAKRMRSFDTRYQISEDIAKDRDRLRAAFGQVVFMTLGKDYQVSLFEKHRDEVFEGRLQKVGGEKTLVGYVPVVTITGMAPSRLGKVFLVKAKSMSVYYRSDSPEPPTAMISLLVLGCTALLRSKGGRASCLRDAR